ncbi:hypothetical protein DPMN_065387 [Dreissena polymorpha]|uniref:Uncharacterized protein n=1 Tax=Dreissena polymorpha TaxID=45954 RepID=A0A9D4BU59_DREPO|nr:hypothetical protein DPMN_065387 [Dreissena polymorpha]
MRLLASAKPLALRHPKASVTALYDVRILKHSEKPSTRNRNSAARAAPFEACSQREYPTAPEYCSCEYCTFLFRCGPVSIRKRTLQLADLRVFIYWRTERHLANGKARFGNNRRFRIPYALYGAYRSAFLLR